MSQPSHQRVAPSARLRPGLAIGARPHGLRGWATLLRRRVRARLRGELDPEQLVRRGLRVGREVSIAQGVYLDPGFPWLISIGDETTLGPGVTILVHDAAPKLRTGYSAIAPVRIGSRVFLGAHSIVMPGVEIGDDAIVGAGTVVRRDVAPGTVVIGNPAQEIGTTAAYTARHLHNIELRPSHVVAGAPVRGEDRRRLLALLRDGPGYID